MTIIRQSYRYLLLTGMMLTLLALTGSASAASRSTSDFGITKTTLNHAGVERLLAKGERIRVTSPSAIRWEVRLFVYQRALERGEQTGPSRYASEKAWISPNTHLVFTHPGAKWVTLRVNRADRAVLLRAGTITEGYFSAGYR